MNGLWLRVFLNYDDYIKEKKEEEARDPINEKILDSILDDDNEQFIQLISQIEINSINPKNVFTLTNYKLHPLLRDHPTYSSVCAFFSAEKCFHSLLIFYPEGASSENFRKNDDMNRSLIHFACFGGNMSIIRELYQSGFDLNAKDSENYEPCHYSAMSGAIDAMKYLLAKGAISQSQSISSFSVSCLYGNLNIVQFLYENLELSKIFQSNINVVFKDKKTTIFHLICEGGHHDILNYILSKKNYPQKQLKKLDSKFRTPLNIACQNGSLNCVKILVINGNVDVNEPKRKHVALIDAVEGGHADIVSFLSKQRKINLNAENSNDLTALDVAILNENIEIIKILINNGATENFNDKKIGNMFFRACGTYNMDIIQLFDVKFKIPYQTMGDMFIRQACKIENEKLIIFLINKGCNINCVTPNDFNYKKNWTPFMTFLSKNGLDYSKMKSESGFPIINHYLEKESKIGFVTNLISKDILDKFRIDKYNLVNLACKNGDLVFFLYLMNYKPSMDNVDKFMLSLINCIDYNIGFDRFDEIKKCLDIAEILLRDYNANPNNQIFLNELAYLLLFDGLELFIKYGADLKIITFIPGMLSVKFIPLIDFLIDKKIDINDIQTNNKNPLIVTSFLYSQSAMIDKLLKVGAILTIEMIEKYELVKIVCKNGEIDLFLILLSYKPSIPEKDLCLVNLISKFSCYNNEYQNSQKEKYLQGIEILLKDYNANCNDDFIISYCSKNCLIDFLMLFAEYGADFSDCSLDYREMNTFKHLEVFDFLEQNGCKFQRHKKLISIDKYLKNDMQNESNDENVLPIQKSIENMNHII